MIYQLAKTTVGLSGQVKWNIILDGNKAKDLQIVPIHESIDFNYTKREDTLRYTHVQNLKRLYDKISADFFNPVVDPKLLTGYPVRNNGLWLDTHENSYEMGLKRLPYKRYGKQFAFFCPLWIDSTNDMFDDEGNFIIQFYLVVENESGQKLVNKHIDIDIIQNYLYEYLNKIELDNRLLNISLSSKTSWIKGVNVSGMKSEIKDTSYIIDNMLDIERPIMEIDDILIRQFSTNGMIASQLFNFNFVFNISDILPSSLYQYLVGAKVNAYIDIYKNGEKIDVRDIYSNYEFIPRFDMDKLNYTKNNCLEYLNDHNCIDLISKNKVSQSIIHWTLRDNPDYMFNLYDGCAPLRNGKVCKGLYFDTPNIYADTYSLYNNPLSWCKNKIIDVDNIPDFRELLIHITNNPQSYCSNIRQYDNIWWYEKLRIDPFEGVTDLVNRYTGILYTQKIKLHLIKDDFYIQDELGWITGSISDSIIYLYHQSSNTLLFVISNVQDNSCSKISYHNIVSSENYLYKTISYSASETLKKSRISDHLNGVYTILSHVLNPVICVYNISVDSMLYDRPDITDKSYKEPEIYYVKNNTRTSYVIRYDGNLYPYFITPNNTLKDEIFNYTYAVKQFNQDINNKDTSSSDVQQFNEYTKTKYSPVYPSIHYFPLKKYRSSIYKYYRPSKRYYLDISWYKSNNFYVLPTQIDITYINTLKNGPLTEDKIKKLLKHRLYKFINIDAYGDIEYKKNKIFEKFFWNMYDYEYTYDYLSNKNIKKYKYRIKYTLK